MILLTAVGSPGDRWLPLVLFGCSGSPRLHPGRDAHRPACGNREPDPSQGHQVFPQGDAGEAGQPTYSHRGSRGGVRARGGEGARGGVHSIDCLHLPFDH